MVNVYSGTEYLVEMLDIFTQNEIKTTFFVGGCWAEKNSDIIQRIIGDGHELGNHGYFHKDHKVINEVRNREEILACHNLIKSISGYQMKLFAPPSGSFGDACLNVAQKLGYTTIMWSRDTIDWRDQDGELITKRAVDKTVGGDLILMHPTKATVSVLSAIIEKLKNKGLDVCTVSQVLNQD